MSTKEISLNEFRRLSLSRLKLAYTETHVTTMSVDRSLVRDILKNKGTVVEHITFDGESPTPKHVDEEFATDDEYKDANKPGTVKFLEESDHGHTHEQLTLTIRDRFLQNEPKTVYQINITNPSDTLEEQLFIVS